MWCNAPTLVPGPWSWAWPPAWLGKEVTVTSPAAELLQVSWPELWWMNIHWLGLTLLVGTWWAIPAWHSHHDKFWAQEMHAMDWNESSLHDARHWLSRITEASDSAQRTQEAWQKQFKDSSKFLPTVIFVSFKLSVVSNLSIWTAASQRRPDP